MISLARTDGARKDLLELCTHNPKKNGGTIDIYTEFPWEALCAEVAKFKITRREPAAPPAEVNPEAPAVGEVNAEKAGEPGGSDPPFATRLATRKAISELNQSLTGWRRRESNLRGEISKSSAVTRVCPSKSARSKGFSLPSRSSPFPSVPPCSPQSWQDPWQDTLSR